MLNFHVTFFSVNCDLVATASATPQNMIYMYIIKINKQVSENTYKAQKQSSQNINYSLDKKIIYFVIDVSTSRRKSSSGLTSGSGRQYVRACPICGSIGLEMRVTTN